MAEKLRKTPEKEGSTAMRSGVFFNLTLLWLVLAACFVVGTQLGQASDVTRVSGYYTVVDRVDAGSNTTVRIRVHLTNQGTANLFIQRMALWDFSHGLRQQVRSFSQTIPANGSVDTTQEFTISRADYQGWRRGNPPKLAVELVTPSGRKTTQMLRVTATGTGKAD